MTYKVLVTGSRDWCDERLIFTVLLRIKVKSYQAGVDDLVLIHGAARGADTIAATVAEKLGYTVNAFPAAWHLLGRAAGIVRNQTMLDQDPDIIVAFNDALAQSKGTKDMVERAKKIGKEVWVYSHE